MGSARLESRVVAVKGERIVANRPPRGFDARFAWVQPGDVLLHPQSGAKIATVVSVNESALDRPGKPMRYRFVITADAIEEGQ